MKRRGFTLLELILALAIAGTVLVVSAGALRVGLAAWRQSDERAEAHQHLRSLSEILARSLAAAFPYRQSRAEGGEAQLQFQGEASRVSFVTFAPPFPLAQPIPFVAVTFVHRGSGERPGLAIREKALPNFEPFEEVEPVFVDPAVGAVTFRYLRPGPDGGWQDAWDAKAEQGLPQAVQIRLTARLGGREQTLPPLTVTIPARTP